MRQRQLIILLICQCGPPLVGMGLFPVLPSYAAQLGATPTLIGVYFAVLSVASVLAALLASRLGPRFGRKRLFVGVGSLGGPALLLLGQATALWQAILLTAVVWLVGGTLLNLISVLTGEVTDSRERGRAFALLFVAFPLGAALGGTLVGQLVAHGGYPYMFRVLALGWCALPLIGLIGLREQPARPSTATTVRGSGATDLGPAFSLLLAAALLSSIGLNMSRLSTSLIMQADAFSADAIASTGSVAGMATIPFLVLFSRVADRLGHRRLIGMSYGLTVVGALGLSLAHSTWQFQLAATLLLIAWCVRGSATSALTTALLPTAALPSALPRVGAMENLAGIVGFAGAGWLMDLAGIPGLVGLTVLLVLAALQCQALMMRRIQSQAPALGTAKRSTGLGLAPIEAAQP